MSKAKTILSTFLVALTLSIGAVPLLSTSASAHTCQYGHEVADTRARDATDLNGDGDTADPGEAAITAADGTCFTTNSVTDRMESVFKFLSLGIAVFIFIKGWRLIVMAITMGITKAFGSINQLFRRG